MKDHWWDKLKTYIDKIVEEVKQTLHIKDEKLAQMYALLVLTKGENITLKDVHDAWAMNMNYKKTTDYCYGHEHKSIVPFDQLDVEVQNKDAKFVDKLKEIANQI